MPKLPHNPLDSYFEPQSRNGKTYAEKKKRKKRPPKTTDEEKITLLTQCAYVISSDPHFSTCIRP